MRVSFNSPRGAVEKRGGVYGGELGAPAFGPTRLRVVSVLRISALQRSATTWSMRVDTEFCTTDRCLLLVS
ncbi:hypothetical protein MPTK1_7g08990 [Marchantia polymorpha subsp. ruderalis]